jgi:hypothetical protein
MVLISRSGATTTTRPIERNDSASADNPSE